jgi:hypothetical protein
MHIPAPNPNLFASESIPTLIYRSKEYMDYSNSIGASHVTSIFRTVQQSVFHNL